MTIYISTSNDKRIKNFFMLFARIFSVFNFFVIVIQLFFIQYFIMYLPKLLINYAVFIYIVIYYYVFSKIITHFSTQFITQLVVIQLYGSNTFFSNSQILLNRQDTHQYRTRVSIRTEWICFFISNYCLFNCIDWTNL